MGENITFQHRNIFKKISYSDGLQSKQLKRLFMTSSPPLKWLQKYRFLLPWSYRLLNVNSLVPSRCGGNFKVYFPNTCYRVISRALHVKLQDIFNAMSASVQVMASGNKPMLTPDLYRHMASLSHNELSYILVDSADYKVRKYNFK